MSDDCQRIGIITGTSVLAPLDGFGKADYLAQKLLTATPGSAGDRPSYGAAQKEVLKGVENRQSRHLNKRAENSHQPTLRRERQMQRPKGSAIRRPLS